MQNPNVCSNTEKGLKFVGGKVLGGEKTGVNKTRQMRLLGSSAVCRSDRHSVRDALTVGVNLQ